MGLAERTSSLESGAHDRRRAHAVLTTITFALAIGLAMLYAFPPERFTFYPLCPIHVYTGLLCPGCGATRAIAALLHGHEAEAMRQNGLITLLLPGALLSMAGAYGRALRGVTPLWTPMPKGLWLALLALAGVYAVVRNLHGFAV